VFVVDCDRDVDFDFDDKDDWCCKRQCVCRWSCRSNRAGLSKAIVVTAAAGVDDLYPLLVRTGDSICVCSIATFGKAWQTTRHLHAIAAIAAIDSTCTAAKVLCRMEKQAKLLRSVCYSFLFDTSCRLLGVLVRNSQSSQYTVLSY
jgi:hypothetical protein